MSIVNKKEFAEIYGKSDKWVGLRMAEGMPHEASGQRRVEVKIDTVTALAWLEEYKLKRLGIGAEPAKDINEERKQLIIEQRRKLEIENSEAEAALVPVEDVQVAFNEAIVELASTLDGAAGRMASGDAVLRQRLLDEHRRIRQTFADRLAHFGGGTARIEADSPAPEACGVEVGRGEAVSPEG